MEQRRVEADPDREVRFNQAGERNQHDRSSRHPWHGRRHRRIDEDADECRRGQRAGQTIDDAALIEQGGGTREEALSRVRS